MATDSRTRLGLAYYNGMGVARDKAKAMALYKKACIGGEMTGCYDLGVCDQVGCGVARDEAKGILRNTRFGVVRVSGHNWSIKGQG